MSENIKNKQQSDHDCGCHHESKENTEHNCGCGHDHKETADHDCGCNHDHDHDHEHGCGCGDDHQPDTITLTLDNDKDVECAVLGVFDYEDKEYIALLPKDGDDVFIYIYTESEDGDVQLANIDSQEDFDKVSAVFLEIMESEEEEEEEEETSN